LQRAAMRDLTAKAPRRDVRILRCFGDTRKRRRIGSSAGETFVTTSSPMHLMNAGKARSDACHTVSGGLQPLHVTVP
jgi:hypothetical protein